MNRSIVSALWNVIKNPIRQVYECNKISVSFSGNQKYFNTLSNIPKYNYVQSSPILKSLIAQPLKYCGGHQLIQTRDLTKYSLRKGKRKTVHAVLKRFYRLDWGIWIRGKCGRQKKLYKKSFNRKRRLRQHVFCNATQSYLLDKMVTSYWRRPKYYIDDPYEPYHKREEFPTTRKKPLIPPERL
ncbi:hypothetical protein O3M35_012364 [Rhynocoris fuscipes]|uniref:Large ribosomal subunit protein bL35m n=1 Tax=Rhynocoris fuscipes TaxID=488301 RepID=A0AAW1CTR3_9HEMI